MEKYQECLEIDLIKSRIQMLQMFLDFEYSYFYDTPDTDLDYALWVKNEIIKEINLLKARCLTNLDLV